MNGRNCAYVDVLQRVEKLNADIADMQREVELLQEQYGISPARDDRKIIVRTMMDQLKGWTATSDVMTEGKIRGAMYELEGLL